MRQVTQSLKTGKIEVLEAPAPDVRPRHILVEARRTLISAGTERMLLEFGKGNLVQKALQQPDKVRQTLQKVKTDGISATLDAVRSKLDQPITLGYCSAGVVRGVGADVYHVKEGDRVVSNAPHAELAVVGRNLAAKIPDSVSDDEAAFTPLAAIALQGCRLAQPQLGETFCVVGLGLIGLLAVQLLRAHGCQVIGIDFSKERLALAEKWGAIPVDLSAGEEAVASALAATGGKGVDGVIIAAATKSDEVISDAANMCRKRGRIVLVGVIGLKLSRADFYEKELSFQVSCSYGPGRYDPDYEVHGFDYPIGFVRWTEQRNFEAVLGEMAAGRLDVTPLINDRIDIGEAAGAYERLTDGGNDLGLLLSYPENAPGKFDRTVRLRSVPTTPPAKDNPAIALIGAGGFATRFTAPGLKEAGATLKTLVSRGGASSAITGNKVGFDEASTDTDKVFADPEIDAVVIATRHDSHADLTRRAIEAGKHVFVEKPLALTEEELDAIEAALNTGPGPSPHLMVGFNRRFSPFSVRMKELLRSVHEPLCLTASINAGSIPADHWTQDPKEGGGRIIGEACHFLDLLRYFTGAAIEKIDATQIGKPAKDGVASDKTTITARFEDGSIGTVHYFANGPASVPKERYEAFASGRYLYLENFKSLTGEGWPKPVKMKGAQNKGQMEILKAFIECIRKGEPSPIPADELIEVSRWTIRAASSAA